MIRRIVGYLRNARPATNWEEVVQNYAPELIESAYRGLLGRKPDAEGLAHWSKFLQKRNPYSSLIQSFANSPEHRRLAEYAPLIAPEPFIDRTVPGETVGKYRFAVFGNCQMGHLTRCLQAYMGGPMPTHRWVSEPMLAAMVAGQLDLEPMFGRHDKLFTQPWIWEKIRHRYGHHQDKVVLFPSIGFMAYQPDLVPVMWRGTERSFDEGPGLRCNSSLIFLGWRAGLSVEDTLALFNREIFERLGFFDFWNGSVAALMEEGRRAEFPLEDLLAKWSSTGCWLHCHVHPKLFVYADIAKTLLDRLGVPQLSGNPIQYVHDYLQNGIVWPVYPEIADELRIQGSYSFKLLAPAFQADKPVHILGLHELIVRCFAAYDEAGEDKLHCHRHDLPSYQTLLAELKRDGYRRNATLTSSAAQAPPIEQSVSKTAHPYVGLPPHQFWRPMVEALIDDPVDPVVNVRFTVDPQTRVAAAGSCFAQHIAHRLAQGGFHFLKTEVARPDMVDAGYTARFGNIYTARQLLQLIQRAYGDFGPAESAWPMKNGRYADPFRPRIEAEGFASIQELEQARSAHLAAVRKMFETLDVFVFTLGLTEAWRSKTDGAVFPLAPGVAAGHMNSELYEFVNFTEAEVIADLEAFHGRLLSLNPRARMLLTVSPVPLNATFVDRHVLVSNAYSKAALRVAAEHMQRQHASCDYFPSYEIITGAINRGRYYDEDLRTVTVEGVDHVMRVFFRHYTSGSRSSEINPDVFAESQRAISLVCEEDLLATAAAK